MTVSPDALRRRAEAELVGNGRPSAEDVRQAVEVAREKLAGSEHLTDLGNARRFTVQHGDKLRYCPPRNAWLRYEGGWWRRDQDGEAERCAKATAVSIYAEAANLDLDRNARKAISEHAKASESRPRLEAMVRLARSEPGIAVMPDRLDADPFLFACPNATIDLRTGEAREPLPDDLITRGTEVLYDAEADCPRWRRFLEEIFDGDLELVAFVRRLSGYILTGDTREQVLPVAWGAGCNGKTTWAEALKRVSGGYAATAAFDSFARARGDRGPRDDLARLHSARFVLATESGKGRRVDESVVKQLTGGDTVTARFLYGEHFEFVPRFKLLLVTNHRPRVDGGDDAIWRRLRLIPFEVSFEGREDRQLVPDLERELPGILRWAVEGCLEWQQDGLGTAKAVDAATREYRESEDVLGAFLSERCEITGETEAAQLRAAYEEFCADLGDSPLPANVLGRELAQRGISRGGKRGRAYRGVSLK